MHIRNKGNNMPELTEAQQIAVTILKQLGGKQFEILTGAENFAVATDDKGNKGLSFTIPRSNNIRGIQIYLNGLDLYNMNFIKIHGDKFEVLHSLENVYCDQLQEIFTEKTGLHTRLFS